MKKVPAPKVPFLYYAKMAKENPLQLRSEIFAQCGDIYQKKIKGFPNIVIANPEYANHILIKNSDNYFPRHPLFRKMFMPVLGKHSLNIYSNKEEWYRARKTLEVIFNPETYFKDYYDTTLTITEKMFELWREKYRDGDYIDIAYEIDFLVISIIINTLLVKVDVDIDQTIQLIDRLLSVLKHQILTPTPIWRIAGNKKVFDKTVGDMRSVFMEIVNARLKANTAWDDAIGYFRQEYKNCSDKELFEILMDETATVLSTGYLTLTGYIHWALVVLSMYPSIERTAEVEVSDVLGYQDLSYENSKNLQYLTRVMREILRMHPSVYQSLRVAVEDDEIDGYPIPKGTGITISTYHINRNDKYWINPDGFDPDRFIKTPIGQSNPLAYNPFGSGERKCPGASFAMQTTLLVTAMFLKNCHLYLPPNKQIIPKVTTLISMRPNVDKMRVYFK